MWSLTFDSGEAHQQGLARARLRIIWHCHSYGLLASLTARLTRKLEEENWRLEKMYAQAQVSGDIVKEALSKNV
jgi:hypothetical protein